MPLNPSIKKVLMLGSGPIVIGQAAEFDYAGSQACHVLKKEGLEVVLINSNPATIMTDKHMADKIYIEPLTLEFVKKIIKLEKPDSLLSTMGGQTALTLSMKLAKEGFLQEHNVRLLGANPETIHKSEDREAFKDTMESINQPVIPSFVVENLEDAIESAEKLGLPVIIRPAFTLGGTGGGIAKTKEQFVEIAENGLRSSPINQILVEKCVSGWKEIEFEVIRDRKGNIITVCSMENFDPVGVHTGDSIVTAPTLTLSDKEFQMLRSAAINIIDALKIEGGCNCQFALNPDSFEYAVIEVNPRVSRSSALASKATGYPIAKIATKIAIGYSLDEIKNDITGKTFACFEPSIDYVVVKFPKFPFDKFVYADKTLGTQMKATGEVMAIGTSFEQAVMKAVRGAEIGLETLRKPNFAEISNEKLITDLKLVDQDRIFRIFEALCREIPVRQISDITTIDKWFIHKLKHLDEIERGLISGFSVEKYKNAKKYGYLDKTIFKLSGVKVQKDGTAKYYDNGIYKQVEIDYSVFKTVDTCAGEFSAETPYFYSTYESPLKGKLRPENEAEKYIDKDKKRVLVLGSGPIRIGQGVEFDYCTVHCARTLRELGYETIILNNNPETVSTDFDVADRLYFDPVTIEDVDNIIATEKPDFVVVQFGGGTAIKLARHIHSLGLKILGTPFDGIDAAEDRERFDAILEECGISRPAGDAIFTTEEALTVATRLGYPVLMRPSYVLGGQNMIIAQNDDDIREYMAVIAENSCAGSDAILIDKYMRGTEIEVDAIFDQTGNYIIPGIMEHIERAGVHSGDSISVYPSQSLSPRLKKIIADCTGKLGLALNVQGMVNIQYVAYDNQVFVIEVNPRSSRTVPYISKVTGVNMVDAAVKACLGVSLAEQGFNIDKLSSESGIPHLYPESKYVAVKVPVFSFEKLTGADSQLGPEMKSTGEVLGISESFDHALYKGLLAAGYPLENLKELYYAKIERNETQKILRDGVLITVRDEEKGEILDVAEEFLNLGYDIYATKGTAAILNRNMIPATVAYQISEYSEETKDINILSLIGSGRIAFVISTSKDGRDPAFDSVKLRRLALERGTPCLTSVDTARALVRTLKTGISVDDLTPVDVTKI